MDKIGINQKKSTYFGAVTTFDFGVNIGEPRRFGAFSEDTMVEMMKKKMLQKLIRQLNLLLMYYIRSVLKRVTFFQRKVNFR